MNVFSLNKWILGGKQKTLTGMCLWIHDIFFLHAVSQCFLVSLGTHIIWESCQNAGSWVRQELQELPMMWILGQQSHREGWWQLFPWSLNWCLGKVVLTLRKPLWAEWKAPLGWRAKLLNLPELWSCCTWSCPSLFGSLSCSPRPVCPFLSYFTVWAVAQYAGGHERGGEALGGNRVGTGPLSSLLPHGQRYSCRQWGGVFELDGNHSESQHGSIASLETFLDMFLSGDCGKGHGIFFSLNFYPWALSVMILVSQFGVELRKSWDICINERNDSTYC